MAVTTPAVFDAAAGGSAPLAPPRAGEQFKILFGLKWRLLLRGFRRSTSAWVGALLFLLVFGPIALGAAAGLGFAWLRAPAPLNAHLLRAVLFGVYLFWLLAPLLGYALNDSYDITRLFVFPISVRRLFAGTILGALLDLPTLLVLPTLLAAIVAFGLGGPGAFALSLATTLLFLFHTLALSQALILASAGVLRSRRFRDIVMVVLPLFWIAYYIASQTLSRRLVSINWRAFLSGQAWETVSFLPPGLAARALARAGSGDLLASLGYLALLALATALTVYAAGWLVEAVYAGEDIGPSIRPSRAAVPAPALAPATTAGGRSLLPPVVEAMAGKELLYLRRDPYFKVTLMNLVYMMVVGVFAFLRGPWQRNGAVASGGALETSPWGLWGASGLLLWGVTGWLFNQWGTEGGAAPALFGFPSDRRRMILGKNLPLYVALVCVNAVFLLALCTVAGRLAYFAPLLVWASLALGVLLAVGNLVSIWFPYRVALRGWRTRQRGTNQGFAYGFLYLGVTAVAAGLLLPVLAAFVIPLEFAGSGWLLVSVPLAALYAAGLYLLSLRLAVPLLLEREQAMIEKLVQSGD